MASKRRLRRNACGRKIKYKSQTEAIANAIHIRKRTGDRMGSYRCRWCNHWHLGH